MWCEDSVRMSCMWECEGCMCDSMRVRVWLTVSVCVVTMWECMRMWGACVTVWGYECVKVKCERVACMCENVGVQRCGWGCVVMWGSFTSSLSWQCTMKLTFFYYLPPHPCILTVHPLPTHLALSGCSLYCEAIQKVSHQCCRGIGHHFSTGSHSVCLGWAWCLCGTNYQLMFYRFPLPVRCSVYNIQDFKGTVCLYLVSVETTMMVFM